MSEEQSGGGSAGCFGSFGIGTCIAVIASWMINHSFLWALIHGCFGWLYVCYLCAGCGGGFPKELLP
jgi:hypothetical protein